MFNDYESRLKLDTDLVGLRRDFEQHKEQLRRALIRRYDVKPPAPTSHIHKP